MVLSNPRQQGADLVVPAISASMTFLLGYAVVPKISEASVGDGPTLLAVVVFLIGGMTVMYLDMLDLIEQEAKAEVAATEAKRPEPTAGHRLWPILVSLLAAVLGAILAEPPGEATAPFMLTDVGGWQELLSPGEVALGAARQEAAAMMFQEAAWKFVACSTIRASRWWLPAFLSDEVIIYLLSVFLLVGLAPAYSDVVDMCAEDEEKRGCKHVSSALPEKKKKTNSAEAAFRWRLWACIVLLVAVTVSAVASLVDGI
jgi:hypothetical protein